HRKAPSRYRSRPSRNDATGGLVRGCRAACHTDPKETRPPARRRPSCPGAAPRPAQRGPGKDRPWPTWCRVPLPNSTCPAHCAAQAVLPRGSTPTCAARTRKGPTVADQEPVTSPDQHKPGHRRAAQIAGTISIIVLLLLMIGNHEGHTEDVFLIAFAALIAA